MRCGVFYCSRKHSGRLPRIPRNPMHPRPPSAGRATRQSAGLCRLPRSSLHERSPVPGTRPSHPFFALSFRQSGLVTIRRFVPCTANRQEFRLLRNIRRGRLRGHPRRGTPRRTNSAAAVRRFRCLVAAPPRGETPPWLYLRSSASICGSKAVVVVAFRGRPFVLAVAWQSGGGQFVVIGGRKT